MPSHAHPAPAPHFATTDVIRVVGARENNLHNVSVDIPKKRITVFTGVSGSGKSSLVFDTIAAESQRQLNDTFSTFVRHRLPHHAQPNADSLENLCAAIVVDQRRLGGNARSTVGTATDILPLIRLLFSRVGQPFVGYSNIFSFNHPDGMCPRCEGLGKVDTIDVDRLFDRNRSLNQGAIRFSAFAVGGYRWKRYVHSGLFDNDKPLKDYSDEEWETLLHAQDVPVTNPGPGWPPSSRYEGVLPRIRRNFLSRNINEIKGLDRAEWDRLVPHRHAQCRGRLHHHGQGAARVGPRHRAVDLRMGHQPARKMGAQGGPPVALHRRHLRHLGRQEGLVDGHDKHPGPAGRA
jgi:excinuclease UvrABC ATPase subunit